MVYQPEVRFLVGTSFHHGEGTVDRMEDVSKSDVIRW